MWLTLNDAYNAERYGYLKYRQPTPGRKLSNPDKDMARIEYEWTKEQQLRRASEYTGGLEVTKFPKHAKEWLHDSLEEIRSKYK